MTFKHKGYTLQQGAKVNHHYMIFAPDGHMVMHVPYNKPVTEEKAKEFIEGYLTLAGKFDDIFDDLQNDDFDD
ncbi:MAG: hypothetical protein HDR01_05940 [Lachnospiraceae bacterium]|nr:hypothetical protein [Lachnospiraceae bacterium]